MAGSSPRAAFPLAPALPSPAGTVERTTLIEFDSVSDAEAAYRSAAYQQALEVLGDAAVRDIRIIEGTA